MENIGRYNVIAELGRGSSGAVFKALDSHLDRLVAIKVLTPSPAFILTPQRTEEMFFREGRATARLMHPGIVEIYDVFKDPENDQPCMVMEFVPGGTLASRLQPGIPLPLAKALELAQQIAEALDYAKSRCFIHRDLKPANVLMGENDRPKITDFGLAEFSGRVGMLMTESIHGTPAYMAPERIKGGKYDERSDLFSLGVILYQMLTGRLPFAGDPSAVLYGIVNENPIPPSQLNPDLPPKYDALVESSLAKEPAQRIPSAREFLNALEKLSRTDTLPLAGVLSAVPNSKSSSPNKSAESNVAKKNSVRLPAPERFSQPVIDKAGQMIKPLWALIETTKRPLPALRLAVLLLLSCTALGGKIWLDRNLVNRQGRDTDDQSAVSASLNFSPSPRLGINPAYRTNSISQPFPNGSMVHESFGSTFTGPLFSKETDITENGQSQLAKVNRGKKDLSAPGMHGVLHGKYEMGSYRPPAHTRSTAGPDLGTMDPFGSYFNKSEVSSLEGGKTLDFAAWGNPTGERTNNSMAFADANISPHMTGGILTTTDQRSKSPKLVRLEFSHDLREGLLTVVIDGKVMITEKLRGRRKSFLGVRETYEGVFSRVFTLPDGARVLSVDVANSDGTEDLNDVAAVDSLVNGVHTLRASVKSDRLHLTWDTSSQGGTAPGRSHLDSASSTETEIHGSK